MICLSSSRIWYDKFNISTRGKKIKKVVLYPFRFIQVEVLASYNAWAFLGYITGLAFRRVEKKNWEVVLYPFWFIQVKVLAYYCAWAVLWYTCITGLAFRPISALRHRKENQNQSIDKGRSIFHMRDVWRYRFLNGDAMLLPYGEAPTWRPEANSKIC